MPVLEEGVEVGTQWGQRGEEDSWDYVMFGNHVAKVAAPPMAEDGGGEGLVAEQG